MHYYPFHPGDYLRDTAHLTNEEDLAYRRLLDFYHQSELPIPSETQTVSRRLRLGFETVNQVLLEFFELREDGWHQARCDAAIAEYQRRCGVNRKVGKLGGRPKKTQTVSSDNPDGTQTKPKRNPNQEPITNNQYPSTEVEGGAGGSAIAAPATDKAKRSRKALAIDDEYLDSLLITYSYADIRHEFAKASQWCSANNQSLSRQRFVNWLNRITPPPTVTETKTQPKGFFDGYARQ